MKKIGFLYGREIYFSQAVMGAINSKQNPELIAENVKIDILYSDKADDYAVVFDRFAHALPFYNTAMRLMKENGTIIVNDIDNYLLDEEFLYLSALKKLNVNVPKTAIIPSKNVPQNITGDMLHNLKYPLNWEELFDTIKFPAQVMSNNTINDFYDCFRIYNINDFFSIYDMSGSNTLILQEHVDAKKYHKIFVVGDKKFILNYDQFQAAKDRYTPLEENLAKKTDTEIDAIIKTIRKNYKLDVFVMDIATSDELYLMKLDKSQINFDTSFIPKDCYDWLVEETANLLIDYALSSTSTAKKVASTVTTKKTSTAKTTASAVKKATTTKDKMK